MRRRLLLQSGMTALLPVPVTRSAWAVATPVKRIGWLNAFAADNPTSVAIEQFYDDELKRRGWERGRNLDALRKHGPRDVKGWEAAARELVEARVDVIVTFHDYLLGIAARATQTIPIVASSGAIVELGLAQSLARPGGNVTGVVSQSHEFSGRLFALLRDLRPGLRRVGVPVALADPAFRAWFDSVEAAAAPLGIHAVALPLPRQPADIAPMLAAAAREQVQALRLPYLPVLQPAVWQQITAWAVEHRVVTTGTLLSRGEAVVCFGPNLQEQALLHVEQIDRVLRGAIPAETPIVQPTLWETVINQRLARAVGWPAPRAVLLQASEVIE
jgi:putative ABC transport system substrate-binding protein